MKPVRPLYRFRQFWRALFAHPSTQDLQTIHYTLTDEQARLFARLQPSEQAHALEVYRRLAAQGQPPHDLLVAGLLHDIGKVRYPLRLWERMAIVLGRALLPRQVKHWGAGHPKGLQRPFVLAARHAAWGAELAEQAGASPLAVELIRRHQDEPTSEPHSQADRLLLMLQQADSQS